MRSLSQLVGRAPFLAGLATGGLAVVVALAVLASRGVVDTDALYPPLSGVVQVWDRHGEPDPDRWELLTPGRHRIANASDVYIETDAVRIRAMDAAGTRLTFAVQPLSRRPTEAPLAPADPTAAAEPAAVDIARDQLSAMLTFRAGGADAQLWTRAAWHGYVLRTEGASAAQRVAIATRDGAWMLQDEVSARAGGVAGSPPRTLAAPPGRALTFSQKDRTTAVVVAATPGARIQVPVSGPVVLAAGRAGRNDVYVGAMSDAATVVTDPSGPVAPRVPRNGRALVSFLRNGRASGSILDGQAARVARPPLGAALASVQRLSGPDQPENLRDEASSGFAEP